MAMMLVLLVIVANSVQDECPCLAETQLLPLQESLKQKDGYLFGLDEVISDLQRRLQGLKENGNQEDQELLLDMKSKVEEAAAKVVELETILVKKSNDLLNLRGQVQTLQSNVESQELEIKQESVLEAQAWADQNEQEIYEVNTKWLPLWAVRHLANWKTIQDKGSFTLKEGWKKAVDVVGAHARVYESKGLKILEVLQICVLTYFQEAQIICKKKIEAAWELSREYMDGPVISLEPYVTQIESVLQPYASKLRKYYNKTLRYGIKHHFELQRKVKSTLQKNRYLASIMSKEVVWLLASAMLVVPLYGILLLFSSFFGKKRGSQSARSETLHR